ncbi:restriction endonuclease subunit S [Streptococcus suis]
MEINNNIPAYRFQGYTDAWELRKLGEVAEIIGGGTPSTSNSEFWDGDIDWYTPAEIGEQIYVDGSERKITQLGLDKSSATLLPANKTILFTSRAGIGKTAILRSDATTNQGFQSIVVDNNTEPYFIFSMTDKIKNKAISVASGSTFAEISSRALGQLEFMFPSINEQSAIGTFFSTLDQQITLHQRKLDTLKEQKKTYLKLLFPAKGQTKPALRFQGFEDDWEEVKLGDVAEKFDNLRVPITASKRISGNTPYYGANGIQDYVEGYTHDGEFILIAEDGANDLKDYPVQYVNGKVWVNNHAHVIQSVRNFASNLFLLRALKTIDIEMYLVGGGRAKLNGDVMMKLPFKIPSLPEQEAIGTFFSTLDQKIAQVEDKLASLKEMKKTLLRKLFV